MEARPDKRRSTQRCEGTWTKVCRDCGEKKPAAEYYRARGRKGTGDKPMCRCVPCYSRKTRAYHRKKWPADPAYRQKVKASTRRAYLKRTFGLDVAGYDRLLAGQGGGCAICRAEASDPRCPRLTVDRAPSGQIRGLVCRRCHQVIGLAQNHPDRFAAIVAYLARHAELSPPPGPPPSVGQVGTDQAATGDPPTATT